MYLIVVILLILWAVNYILMAGKKYSISMGGAFESGFENQNWIFSQPSLHFFSVGMIFVLFDLELLYLLGLFFSMNVTMTSMVLFILLSTLWLEYNLSTLNWVI